MGPIVVLVAGSALAQDALQDVLHPVDPMSDRIEHGIINGDPATAEEWPQTGGLVVGGTITVAGFGTFSGRLLMCSSTLIAPDVVLTAAHCIDIDGLLDVAGAQGVQIESLEDLEIAFSGEADLSRYEANAALTGILPDWPEDAAFGSVWIDHDGFDLFTLQVGLAENDDIGLIFLEEPIFDVPFAILPTPDEVDQIVDGADVVIVGWGQQEQDALPGTVGTKQVADSYIAGLADFEFRVGEVVDDGRKCHGDSGGPSFLEVQTDSSDPYRLIGVTSHAYDATTDCRVTGGVDTRVDFHLAWIDEQMRGACADGTRSWCDEPGILPPPDATGAFPWELAAAADLEGEEAKGCGCDTSPASGFGATLALLGLLAIRRR